MDVTPIAHDPGGWIDKAGTLGVLLVGLGLVGYVLWLTWKMFLARVDKAEKKCEDQNTSLLADLKAFQVKYEKVLTDELGEAQRDRIACTTAMERMSNVAERMVELAERSESDRHRTRA